MKIDIEVRQVAAAELAGRRPTAISRGLRRVAWLGAATAGLALGGCNRSPENDSAAASGNVTPDAGQVAAAENAAMAKPVGERDVDYGENYPTEGGDGAGSDDQPVVTADAMQEREDLLHRCIGISVNSGTTDNTYYSQRGLVPVTIERAVGKLAGGNWEYGANSGTWLYRISHKSDLTGKSSDISLQFALNDDKLSRDYTGKCGPGRALLVGAATDGVAETPQQVYSDYLALIR